MMKELFMKCRQRSVMLMALLMLAVVAFAVPAKPGQTRLLTLSNGTTVTATLVGDEHGHFWKGTDGKSYQMVAGSDIFQEVNSKTIIDKAQQRRAQANQRRAQRLAPRRVGAINPIIGDKKGLIILVNFSDVTFQSENNKTLYERIANEIGFSEGNFKGSMYDYFLAQSDEKFKLKFDVVGPVTVSNSQSYYGGNDSQGNDLHPAAMIIEALKLADSQVNYANYDWDGNGEVEQVYVVYAGKGEADGGADNTIWPHEWTLSSAQQYGDGKGKQKLDGVYIDTYACGGELNGNGNICGIGTMCHEFSHCLGYPDFYDTDYSDGQGMGNWDLMDSGSYNDDGYRPAGFTSYERWVAGWKTPITLENTQTISNMKALQNTGSNTYIIYNKGNNNEFFLLENRQQIGWDTDLPGAGLLILHVDYDETAWANNQPNDDPSHQRMTWIAADNKYQYETYDGQKYYTISGMANDPYPYGTNNAFGRNTTPAAKFYNKNSDGTYYMDSSVKDITQNNNGTVSFKFVDIATPTFSPKAGRYETAQTITISCATEGATIYYTLDGTTPTTSSSVYSVALAILETTTIKAMAVLDGEESDVATATYKIGTNISGTADNPYTVAEARAAIDEGTDVNDVYAKGIVSQIVTAYNSQYGNITYDISTDGTTASDQLRVYRGKSYNGTNFTSADDIQVGDQVVVRGNLILYKNSVYEFEADNQLVSLVRDDTPTPDPGVGTDSYALVTDASTLAAGDEILIAYINGDDKYVLSTTQQNTNRKATNDVTVNSNGTLTPGDAAQVITLEKDGSNYLFNVGNGYLYAASSTANQLKTEDTADDNAKATISISDDDATIVFQGGNERNNLRFNANNGNAIFSCYASTSSIKTLPQIYRKVSTPSISLSNNGTDNTSTITTNDNKIVNVTLNGRTLKKNGEWNTICLPFNVTLAGSALDGATAKTLTNATMTGSHVTLTFGEAVNTLQAGVPYIIKWASGTDIENPVFNNVKVVSSSPADRTISKASGNVKFIGYYDAFDITAADEGIYYMTSGNKLVHTGIDRTLKACRAYFQFSEAAAACDFVLNFEGEGETTSITEVRGQMSDERGEYFDLQGRRVMNPTKGLYIVNGKKIVIK